MPANQDYLTDNVILSRGDEGPLCNVVIDTCSSGSARSKPGDTEWAVGNLADYQTLTYDSLLETAGGFGELGDNIVGLDLVLHLITDDIYLQVEVTSWDQGGSGGGFSYTRTSAVPVPAAVWLFGSALGGLAWMRRRKTA